jgi:small-conductance mechanosensitive channel
VVLLRVAFNLSLTPILTTLGVGGLAVALALQDTLSNLFAGFYVSISGLVRMGDYIKLSTGEEGYVRDINWRCTTMLGTTNNLVVVPNSKLGQAIFTNYHLPETRMGLSLQISVGYDSDLDRAEAILLEEAVKASKEVRGMVPDPVPYIRFQPGLGDSALIFQVNYSVAEFPDQYPVQSELRKRLYRRLKAENISMPYPTQSIILENKS